MLSDGRTYLKENHGVQQRSRGSCLRSWMSAGTASAAQRAAGGVSRDKGKGREKGRNRRWTST